MTWIKIIPFEAATGKLKKLYNRVKGPDNNVDNILLAHSLRPHSLQGHMMLYKNVLHNSNNEIPKHFLETLGVYVSFLNQCDYCVQHHFQGLKRLLADDARSQQIWKALKDDTPQNAFDGKWLKAIQYAKILTKEAAKLTEEYIDDLRAIGWDDGQILEINQVCSYFAYANRTVLGLGVTTQGDIIGLSPNDSDDPDNWNHA
jgi:uncharacterized peroxidase-related enzyme